MSNKQRKVVSVIVVSFITAVLIATNGFAQERYVFKLGTIASPHHVGSWPQNVKFAELVKAKTNGRVEIQVIGESQLGDERKLAESLQMGTLELAGVTAIVLANWEKKLEVLALPYTFNSFKAQYAVQYGSVGKDAAESLRKKASIRILTYITGNYRQFFTNKLIKTLSDLKGLRMRATENPIYISLFRALGANPVPMGYGEIFTALKSGVVDGFDVPAWVVPLSSFHEAVRYCAVTNHLVTPFTISISEKIFQKLPPDIQKALIEAAEEIPQWWDPRQEELEKNSLRDLSKVNVTVTWPDLAPFRSIGKKIVDDWASKNNMTDVIKTIQAIDAGTKSQVSK